MIVETCKKKGDGWFINGSMSVPNDTANRHYQMVQDWIAAGNTPEPEYSNAEVQAQKTQAAKTEASRRIFEVVDANAQMNLASAAAAGILTSGQMTTYQTGLQWVAGMRAKWPVLVADGADIYDDANWPAVPAGVQALADQF